MTLYTVLAKTCEASTMRLKIFCANTQKATVVKPYTLSNAGRKMLIETHRPSFHEKILPFWIGLSLEIASNTFD